MHRICDIIAERKLTQTKAARLLGIDQPKVSALIRGKLDGFSLDRLFRFLNALGRDVEIVVRARPMPMKGYFRVSLGVARLQMSPYGSRFRNHVGARTSGIDGLGHPEIVSADGPEDLQQRMSGRCNPVRTHRVIRSRSWFCAERRQQPPPHPLHRLDISRRQIDRPARL